MRNTIYHDYSQCDKCKKFLHFLHLSPEKSQEFLTFIAFIAIFHIYHFMREIFLLCKKCGKWICKKWEMREIQRYEKSYLSRLIAMQKSVRNAKKARNEIIIAHAQLILDCNWMLQLDAVHIKFILGNKEIYKLQKSY